MCTYIYVYTYIYKHMYKCVCIYILICIHLYILIYPLICTDTCIYTHVCLRPLNIYYLHARLRQFLIVIPLPCFSPVPVANGQKPHSFCHLEGMLMASCC